VTVIAKPAESLFDTAPEELVPVLESMAQAVRADANWKVRKKTLVEALMVVETMTELTPRQQDAFGTLMKGIEEGTISEEEAKAAIDAIEAEEVSEEEEEDGIAASTEVLPVFIGAILERLEETELVCAEQAALYLLSAHPEHYEAAEAWLQADLKNTKAFKKLLRADRRYAALFDLILGPEDEDDIALPEDEGEDGKGV